MEIWIFGNPDLPEDSLPIKLLPVLQRRFPQHQFLIKDPLDEWEMPKELLIIDTIKGLGKVEVFDSLGQFENSPRVTMHDYDLFSNLAFLQKLKKLPKFKIFGVPPEMDLNQALTELQLKLSAI
ncbi:hypothetical protein C4546_04190 [Candidatus Parcubacteria bacterium]|jgi:Ni,Fe-hydrogenase maturation factor|nr:MAG: hypothetical protein C4546_04190 [Candidatus Parcubacteria bacterium]